VLRSAFILQHHFLSAGDTWVDAQFGLYHACLQVSVAFAAGVWACFTCCNGVFFLHDQAHTYAIVLAVVVVTLRAVAFSVLYAQLATKSKQLFTVRS
jgi:hypothetical protein